MSDSAIARARSEPGTGVLNGGRLQATAIPIVECRNDLPLSFAQERLWFLSQMEGGARAYQSLRGFHLQGETDHAALRRALNQIVARHEALRTAFTLIDGKPVQRISGRNESQFLLTEHDLREYDKAAEKLDRLIAEEEGTSLDLETGPPVRARLIRRAEDDHILLITIHHIVSDLWSFGIFSNELSVLYSAYVRGEGDPLPELSVQYADYAVWQRRRMEGRILREQSEYWKTTLAGAPVLLQLPTDRPRPVRQSYSGALAELALNEELTAGLRALSRRHGTTPYMTLLAGWAALMARLSGLRDVVIGTPAAGRRRVEIERLIGLFVNVLPLRLHLPDSLSVGELLAHVRSQAVAAQKNQDIPFEQMVELTRQVRSLSHSPVFQVMFAWQNAPQGTIDLPGLLVSSLPVGRHAVSKFDLTLSLQQEGGRIVGRLEYATALFEQATIERYLGYFRALLQAMVSDDTQEAGRLPILPDRERRQILFEWNATDAGYPREKCVHELFEGQAEKTPDAVAVVFENDSLSYAELNRRANRMAHYLRDLSVKPDDLVAICVERSLEMVIGLLAILKAGGAYVPIDPAYPTERLRQILADAAPRIVLSDAIGRSALGAESLEELTVLDLFGDLPSAWSELRPANPDPHEVGLTLRHLAYVIYTSGSTGMPKGVMVEHRNVVNFLCAMSAEPGITAQDRLLAVTSLSFDIAGLELYLPLSTGAQTVIAGRHTSADPYSLRRALLTYNISMMQATPAMWRALLDAHWQRPPDLTILCGGEALSCDLSSRLRGRDKCAWNLYGPTETTIWSSCARILRPENDLLSGHSIGRPIGNTRIYILDGHGEPVPSGVAGELCIGGAGVARGYWNRPELTAERFVSDPFAAEPHARMYKTGDLGRWLADGTIEFMGRNDFQVKIRGYRIEVGEIEARLLEHEDVREAVVMAREDTPGDKRLVAYYIVPGHSEGCVGADALRTYLAAKLPEYMVPSAYVRLEKMPSTPNGKVDRKGLPAPEGDAYGVREYEEPREETERTLAEIWRDVLKIQRVGRRDNFFELGGHSLLAVSVVSRIRQILSVEAAIHDLFLHPTLSDFARNLRGATQSKLPQIGFAERDGRLPLSFAQQRLWFLAQMEGGSEAYRISLRLHLRGNLNVPALKAALNRVVLRHEALRTTFVMVDGEPVQRIAPAEGSGFALEERDLRGRTRVEEEAERLLEEQRRMPFDLERGPLIRGRLIRMTEDGHALLITMHHIVSDGWSLDVLRRELSAFYGATVRGESDSLPEAELQYADYAVWQRHWMEGEILGEQTEYWKSALEGAPALLEIPADHARPEQQDFAGALVAAELEEELTDGLKALSRRQGTTLYMTMLAGWAALLGRLSGQADVVIGSPVANRGRTEIEGLIGFFANTVIVRVNLAGLPTVGELLKRVKAQAIAAQQHQDLPFEQLVEIVRPERSLSHSPIFQAMFAWQNAREGGLELPGVEVRPLPPSPHLASMFDLTLSLREEGGKIVGGVEYATSLFERSTVERYLRYYKRLLEGMVTEEGKAIDCLGILSDAERNRIVREWNETGAEYEGGKCVHELFAEQVENRPEAVAVVDGNESLSYSDLNRRANQLAHYLRKSGVSPETPVGICMERSADMVVAMLGILKAGGAYVPMDPSYPAMRIGQMVEDAQLRLVLTQHPVRERLETIDGEWISLDRFRDEIAGENEQSFRSETTPEHLAYVIYTSGSTGTPKGVAVSHRALANKICTFNRYIEISPATIYGALTSIGFDPILEQVFSPLCAGGTSVILAEQARYDAWLLMADVERLHVSVLDISPALAGQMVSGPENRACLDTLIIGSDVLPTDVANGLRKARVARRVLNLYGPTETCIDATAYEIPTVEITGSVPIGRPLPGYRIYLLDPSLNPAPVGVKGEIYIGGAGVARGYLRRPELTAERFVPDAFTRQPGRRMYKTGDWGRWSSDGNIEFGGRNDEQVKIRGYRIEPGEIEARLREHEGVGHAVVVVREDAPEEKRLVAYYTAREREGMRQGSGQNEQSTGPEQLRAYLSTKLPGYMVPAAYVRLGSLPLTPNGKVYRKGLPAPEAGAFAAYGYEAPVGEVEEKLAGIWSELLRLKRVSRNDNFFELGGHSLLAVRVMMRVLQTFGIRLAVSDIFAWPTLGGLGRCLSAKGDSQPDLTPIPRARRDEDLPLSFAQQRLWFLMQMEGTSEAYHMSCRARLKGGLNREALRRALGRVMMRHEALRTTFVAVNGEPMQRIRPAEESVFQLSEQDLRGHSDAEGELERLVTLEAGTAFNPETGPLIRGRLIGLGEDEHVLLITMHHIVSDGWSIGVLYRELNALYAAYERGEEDPLPPLDVQYGDYAVWQRRWMEGEILRAQTAYWKQTLAGAPPVLELPTDHARPAQQEYAGGFVQLDLDVELSRGLKALGRRHGATLFMTLLAGWGALLARLSGQQDVVIGMPVANRRWSEIEGLIGFFVNTLAIRLDFGGTPTVAEQLERVRRHALAAQENQDIPFEQLVGILRPVRSMSHSPMFQVLFAWQNEAEGRLELPGVEAKPLRSGPVTAKFDLTLSLREEGERIVGGVEYARSLFERRTVERYSSYFRALLQGMVAAETAVLHRLPMLSEREREKILHEWNDAKEEYKRDKCVHELFEEQVAKSPDALAVVHEDRELTYRELNLRANRLAHYLRGLGVKPDTRVGICVERGLEMVSGILAIWKSGGGYVPLDPDYPGERLLYMLEDSAPIALLTQAHLKKRFGRLPATLPTIDLTDASAWSDQPECNPERSGAGLTSQHLAYVIYTSGSTGRPKGVLIEHANVVRLFAATHAWFQFQRNDVWTLFHSYAFDFSVWEMWGALLYGGRLIVVSRATARSADDFYRLVCREKITILNQTPSAFRTFIAAQAGSGEAHGLRYVIFGGEALEAASLRPWYKQNPGGETQLVNMYGISETTVHVTYRPLEPRDSEKAGGSPIGVRIPDLRVYILDRHGEAVPVGVYGELHIGGAGVARGYLNRPELTAERFLPDLYGAEEGARMYKTGDVGRWLSEGNIEFFGRNDDQVKIRGYRIEPGEIEARLMEHGKVREAVVVVRGEGAEKRLIAYYTATDFEEEIGPVELRAHMTERVPEHMVPAAYVRLEAMPLTANGKLDRTGLPEPGRDVYASRGYEAPQSGTETAVAAIWTEVLQLERVGRYDNFFELGGNSLMVVRVVSRVRQTLRVKVALADLFSRPGLMEFSGVVATASRAELPPMIRAERRDELELSFAQQRLWFLDQLQPNSSAYNAPLALRLKGGLNLRAVREAVCEIVRRHEVLRTTFMQVDAGAVQIIHPHTGFSAEIDDLGRLPEAEREDAMRRRLQQESERPFDLMHGPLLCARILRLGTDDHILLIVMHHIVSDAWSEHILLKEFASLYAAFSAGKPSPLKEMVLQYGDFAVWQRKWLRGPVLAEQLDYWKAALRSMHSLELPADRSESNPTTAGGVVPFRLTAELAQKVKRLSQSQGVTLFMTLTGAFHLLLGWYANQDDVIAGTDVANRNRPEIEGMIGFFVNQLVLRTNLSGDPAFSELLQRVRTATLGAYAHQEFPFEKLVEELSPDRISDRSPLFNVKLVFQNVPTFDFSLPELRIERIPVGSSAAKYSLLFTLWERAGTVQGFLEYQRDLFESGSIDLLLSLFSEILNVVAEDPRIRIGAIHVRLHSLKESHRLSQRDSLQSKLERKLAFAKRKDRSA